MSDSLWAHRLQHARLPCPSATPGAHSNSCPLSRWCHQTISSSVIPFSSSLQSFLAPGSFPISQFFPTDGQSIWASASASVIPLFPHLFAIKWWDQMPWSWLFESWVLSQLFHSPLSPCFTVIKITCLKTWKQPQSPSTDRCIKKMWYVYTTRSHVKRMKQCYSEQHGRTQRLSC